MKRLTAVLRFMREQLGGGDCSPPPVTPASILYYSSTPRVLVDGRELEVRDVKIDLTVKR